MFIYIFSRQNDAGIHLGGWMWVWRRGGAPPPTCNIKQKEEEGVGGGDGCRYPRVNYVFWIRPWIIQSY